MASIQNNVGLTTSGSSGNTKPSRPNGRHFQLTLNEVSKYDALKSYLTGLKNNNYFISCLECAPSTGHNHIHIYVQFDRCIQLGVSKCQGAHIEVCRGSPQQNVEYIKKDGNILDEIGTLRIAGNPTIREIRNMTSDEIEELPWQMYNSAKKIKEETANDLNVNDIYKPDLKVIYIWGPSGIGKSKRAFEIVGENGGIFNQLKFDGNFWHGVGTATVCVYDDFRDSHMKPSEFINFIDYNVHPLNIKGGTRMNKYKLIIITSVQNPENLYMNVGDEPRRQWLRRMEIFSMEEDATIDTMEEDECLGDWDPYE